MAESEKGTRSYAKLLLLMVAAMLVGAIALGVMWWTHPEVDYWKGVAGQAQGFLERNAWSLFLAIAILPGLGFPISLLLVLTGTVLVEDHGYFAACLFAISAQALCSIWSYFAATGPFRGMLEKFLLRNRGLPALVARDAVRITFIIRITPGIPFPVQNYSLGILKIPFGTYLLVSLPIQALYAIGFVVTGGAIFDGSVGLLITGLLLLLALVTATRMFVSKRKNNVRHGRVPEAAGE